MRIRRVVGLLVWLGGCTKSASVPLPPDAPAPVAQQSEAEPVELPTHPTPAFMPRENGGCSRAYTLVSETCVHRYYQQSQPGGLEKALAAYKRGAAPPLLGPVPKRGPAPATTPRPLDPGALAKRSEADAEKAKEKRLAELDQMLMATREKLRERDEAGKARSVPNAARKGEGERAESQPVLVGAATGANPGDPAAARLNELSQLAGQLSGEQLQSLMAELGKSGINTSALDELLRRETGQPPPGL